MDAIVQRQETNLIRILREKNINTHTIALVIGVKQDASAKRKIDMKYPFTIPEAMAIHKNLLPEYSFDYLFREYADIKADDSEA